MADSERRRYATEGTVPCPGHLTPSRADGKGGNLRRRTHAPPPSSHSLTRRADCPSARALLPLAVCRPDPTPARGDAACGTAFGNDQHGRGARRGWVGRLWIGPGAGSPGRVVSAPGTAQRLPAARQGGWGSPLLSAGRGDGDHVYRTPGPQAAPDASQACPMPRRTCGAHPRPLTRPRGAAVGCAVHVPLGGDLVSARP